MATKILKDSPFYKLLPDLAKQIEVTNKLAYNKPLVSVAMCTYNTPKYALQKSIDSILSSSYKYLELCITDDGSANTDTIQVLKKYAKDSRIKLDLKRTNEGISNATNKALEMCTGEFIAFIDHDDEITVNAIETCIYSMLLNDLDVVYTDQATINIQGRIIHEFRKPAWSPEYLRHVMYVGHLLIMRRTIIDKIGFFNPSFDGVQDFEYMLRAGEVTKKIGHVPEILYFWRAIEGSLALETSAKRNISELQAKAVQEHMIRQNIPATAHPHERIPHRCRIAPKLKSYPLVSIIIPTKDSYKLIKTCLESIFSLTAYPFFEVICVDTGSVDPAAIHLVEGSPAIVMHCVKSKFNFSAACNHGASKANGEILLFLNNDTEVLDPQWIHKIVLPLLDERNGIAGPLLSYPNETVQHAGVVIGPRGTADHAMRFFPCSSDGYAGSLSCSREVSAITGACLGIKARLFKECNGFNELYHTHYQDVDLCLKIRSFGLNCIYVASTTLIHHESISRGGYYDMLDRMLFIDTWANYLNDGDPFYNASLDINKIDYSIAPRLDSSGSRLMARKLSVKQFIKKYLPRRIVYSANFRGLALKLAALLNSWD